jgi:pimeloyl-ACP methyl ester carboxylesterase
MNGKKRSLGCLGKILRVTGIFALVIILLFTVLGINQKIALSRTRAQYPAPGKLVRVENHRMHINCKGSGSPTVVIDAGNGSFSVEWIPIQEALSTKGRVCIYDRSGYGWSEPGPEPRDGNQVVSELHQLLQAAGEPGPYLLVGHSLGGVHVRLYSAQYPAEVAGLVLIDTANPMEISPEFRVQMQSSIGFYQVMNLLTRSGLMRILGPLGGRNSMPETARKLPLQYQEVYLNLLLDTQQYITAISEMEQIPQTFQQVGQIQLGYQPFGGLPLIVLTAGQTSAPGSSPFSERLVPASNRQIEFQSDLARLSSRGEQRLIARSGHSVHLDAPEEVIRAVRDLVETVNMD